MQIKAEEETITNQTCWYALRSKPNFEHIVFIQLEDRNIETYFPQIDVKPVNPRASKQKPFFPGYMFVKGGLGDLYATRIGLLRGVVGLVSFDGIPAPIPDRLIEVIQRQVGGENRKVDCRSVQLIPGDRVWIDDPILNGIEARFEKCINGEDRVAVLLSLLRGQTVRIQIDADKVKRRTN
ncbi:MAG: hypothetical protein GX768_05080 [Chloroflexi bacterium]|jgi:transcriptional antiterminator RfaH|nr:hypothetical protein [Chloroflexota bacterium]